jgi:ATPase subunit of ABC transporter with duplicated ATPase domains
MLGLHFFFSTFLILFAGLLHRNHSKDYPFCIQAREDKIRLEKEAMERERKRREAEKEKVRAFREAEREKEARRKEEEARNVRILPKNKKTKNRNNGKTLISLWSHGPKKKNVGSAAF